MRTIQRTGRVWWALLLVIAVAAIGCRRDSQPPASTTTPPGVTVSPAITTPPVVVAPAIDSEPSVVSATPIEPATPAETAAAAPDVEIDIEVSELPEPVAPVTMPNMVALNIELPAPAFRGTPVPLKEPNVEKPRGEPRGPFLAPEGTVNLSVGKAVICSDPAPPSGEVDFVTDGDKEASDFGYLELRPGAGWVQIDLGTKGTVYAVLIWHNHADARVYRDVIVQVSDDPDFIDAQTVFNNDYDNSSGMGIGQDMGYVETSEGKLIDCRGVEGRYVRLHSKGSHLDGKNHYTEVEVFGIPAG